MIRNKFFEDPVFTSMSREHQQVFNQVWKKILAFEKRTDQSLDDGFTREQYVDLFNALEIRRINNFYQYKTLLSKYISVT